jgi:hypothetical protein
MAHRHQYHQAAGAVDEAAMIADERYRFGDVRVATLALLTRTVLSG